ncbi:MAG TPA: hypothetical protein VKA48_05480 [Gammaproteobacteria bacterium]|nr:hypothetical protein [Gammaproteobacteria bacterium]
MPIPRQEAVQRIATDLFEELHGNYLSDAAKSGRPAEGKGAVQGCFDLFAYSFTGLTAWSNGLFTQSDFAAWAERAGRVIAAEDLEGGPRGDPGKVAERLGELVRGLPGHPFLAALGELAETPDLFHAVETALPENLAAAERAPDEEAESGAGGLTASVAGAVRFIGAYRRILEDAGLPAELPREAYPYLIAGIPALVAEAGRSLPA